MPEIIYICGHGSWTIKDGYTKVPKGCSIIFYTQFNKTLGGDDAHKIVAGTYTGSINRTIKEFKHCPNLKYYPDTVPEIQQFNLEKQVGTVLEYTNIGNGKSLETFFQSLHNSRKQATVHWACCQYLAANLTYDSNRYVGKPKTGTNLTEMSDGLYQYDYNLNQYFKVF